MKEHHNTKPFMWKIYTLGVLELRIAYHWSYTMFRFTRNLQGHSVAFWLYNVIV